MRRAHAAERIRVGRVADFTEGDRVLVETHDVVIGVFRVGDDFVAYENRCLHQGGPVCEGQYFPKVEAVVTGDGKVLGERFAKKEPHLVCPWHGWEYDLSTGEAIPDRRLRLRRYEVVTDGGDVYVLV